MDDAFQLGDIVYFIRNSVIFRGTVTGRRVTEYTSDAPNRVNLGQDCAVYLVGHINVDGQDAYASMDDLICDLRLGMRDI